jgi:RNA-splicing ligase RtcB
MDEAVLDQITNVATLPGITKYALCMPDGHSGYGFPIGGVAAMDVEAGGVISPGGIGFDINCRMWLVVTNLTYDDVKPLLTGFHRRSLAMSERPLSSLIFDRVFEFRAGRYNYERKATTSEGKN